MKIEHPKFKAVSTVIPHPIITLIVIFLIITGVACGLSTYGAVAVGLKPQTLDAGGDVLFSVPVSLLISVLSCAIIISLAILCAVWMPGIALLTLGLIAWGFSLSFSVCSICSDNLFNPLQTLAVISLVIVPSVVKLFAFLRITVRSMDVWRGRFVCFVKGTPQYYLPPAYVKALIDNAMLLGAGIILEGLVTPLLLRLIL